MKNEYKWARAAHSLTLSRSHSPQNSTELESLANINAYKSQSDQSAIYTHIRTPPQCICKVVMCLIG